MHADFEAHGHHAQRIMHAALLVKNEFLGQQVQNFTVCGQRDGAGFIDGKPDFIARNFARTCAKAEAAMTVHAANMRTRQRPAAHAR